MRPTRISRHCCSVLGALANVIACSPDWGRLRPPQNCFALLATADVHGAITPTMTEQGDTTIEQGGLIGLSGYLRILKQRYQERWLLLDAGDMYHGTFAAQVSEGSAVIAAMNLLGYHAAAIGNHDFDYGAGRGHGQDPLGVLRKRAAQASFPLLGANIYVSATNRGLRGPNIQASAILMVGAHKIGVVGVSTTETPRATRADNVAGLAFRDPTPVLVEESRALRAKGAQLVILLAHMGGRCTDLSNPRDTSSCEADSELFSLLRALPSGTVDVAVGGHNHTLVAHWVGNTAVMEPGAGGRHLGWAEICLQASGGLDEGRTTISKPVPIHLRLWRGPRQKTAQRGGQSALFLGRPVVPDEALVAAMKPYLAAAQQRAERPLGISLPRPLRRSPGPGDGSLGRVVADAMREAAGAQLGLQNLGGVRADLLQGALHMGELYRVLPFDNRLAVLTVTGTQLTAIVRHMTDRRKGEAPHMVGVVVRRQADGLRLSDEHGQALAPKGNYVVATNDFLTYGGDGLAPVLAAIGAPKAKILQLDLRAALIDYLSKRYPDH